jgi:hypothetical protein
MRIVAKGMISPNYWGHGRAWPRHSQIEVDVTPEEYEAIATDKNIVCVAVPEPLQEVIYHPGHSDATANLDKPRRGRPPNVKAE